MTHSLQVGNGALALACYGGHLEMVEKLIEMGFSVNESHQVEFSSLFLLIIYLCDLE